MVDWFGDSGADDLAKIVLLLAAAWVGLEIVGRLMTALTGWVRPLVALAVLALVLLWYDDRI